MSFKIMAISPSPISRRSRSKSPHLGVLSTLNLAVMIFASGGEGEKTFIGFGDQSLLLCSVGQTAFTPGVLFYPNKWHEHACVLGRCQTWQINWKPNAKGYCIYFQLESKSSTFRKGMKVSIRFHWSVEDIFEYYLYMFEWFLSSIQSEVSKSLIAEWDINPSRNSSVSQNRWEMGQMFLALV